MEQLFAVQTAAVAAVAADRPQYKHVGVLRCQPLSPPASARHVLLLHTLALALACVRMQDKWAAECIVFSNLQPINIYTLLVYVLYYTNAHFGAYALSVRARINMRVVWWAMLSKGWRA